MPIELILWDLDGTLLRGNGIGREATRLAMEAVYGTSGNLANHRFGGKTDWYTLLELLTPLAIPPETVSAELPRYAQVFADAMNQLLPQYRIDPLEGGHQLVEQLTAHPTLLHGVVTGNVYATSQIKLRAAGYPLERFPFGAYGDEAIERAELPKLALARAEKHAGRTIARENVLILGDTVEDIIAARANGMQVCIVAGGFSDLADLQAAAPDVIIPSLTAFGETFADAF
ncbi:MAG: HAD family hydrolase [Phototrophicaceae bacterium]